MADSLIAGLNPATALTGVEPFPSEQSLLDVRVSAAQIKAYAINSAAQTAPTGGISPLVYWDGTNLVTDSIPSHLGYNATTDSVSISNLDCTTTSTTAAKFTNTATSSSTAGSGLLARSDDGAALASGDRTGFLLFGGAVDAAHTISNTAGIVGYTTEAQTATANGSKVTIETTANGTAVRRAVATFDQDGSAAIIGKLTVGSGVTGFDFGTRSDGAVAAIYGEGVVKGLTNYILQTNGGTITSLNSTGTTGLLVSGTARLAVTSTGAAVTGTLSSTGALTVGSGVTGLVAMPWTGGSYGALYSTNVTPAGNNPALLSNGAITFLNGTTNARMSVGTVTIVDAVATGAAVTGTLSSTGVLSVPAGTSGANAIQFGGSATTGFYSPGAGQINTSAALTTSGQLASATFVNGSNGSLYIHSTNGPTIASGFGTSPVIVKNGTAAFKVTIGTGGAASGVLTFPAATTGWAVHCTDKANTAGIVAVAYSTSTTSVTVEAYSRTTGLASTFSAGDVLECSAMGY